jgi:DNA-binding transcriptional MerR regulator
MTRARSTAKPTRSRSLTNNKATPANGADRQIKIGEAARLIGVEAYVLRFWETQFPFLRPRHSRSKHRYYDEKSLDYLRLIRRLLHGEGYTIAGARKHIRETGLDRLRSSGEGDRAREAGEGERPRTLGAGEPSKGPEKADTNAGHRDEARPATSRAAEFSRTTQDKLAAIRDELRSLHKLLAR